MGAVQLDYPVFDADNHMYETDEAFTRYLPKEHSGLIRYVTEKGRTKIAIRGVLTEEIPNPTFEVVARPGAHHAYYAQENFEGRSLRELSGQPIRAIPAYRAAEPRLALLDELGIDATMVFPTLGSLLEVRFMDDPDLTLTLLHAFNEWMYDEWKFDFRGRIFATPVLNPCIPERGIKELEWVLEHGAKVILVRPAPVAGYQYSRSPFLPEFDPFWARVQDSEVLVAFHASNSGYQRYADEWNGRPSEFLPFSPAAFTLAATEGRAITDTFFSAITHGVLSRFPRLKFASVENGGSWAGAALKTLDHVYGKVPQDFAENPHDVFLRNIYISPFWEDSVGSLIEMVGADHVLFGSDYPHPEGMADPVSWVETLTPLVSPSEVQKIMGGNLYQLINA